MAARSAKHRIEITIFCPPETADKLPSEITLEIVGRLQDEPRRGTGEAEVRTGGAVPG